MSKTTLKRDILLTAQRNPQASNKEIARTVDCSASYVSQILNEYSDYDDVEAIFDGVQKDADELFDDLR